MDEQYFIVYNPYNNFIENTQIRSSSMQSTSPTPDGLSEETKQEIQEKYFSLTSDKKRLFWDDYNADAASDALSLLRVSEQMVEAVHSFSDAFFCKS